MNRLRRAITRAKARIGTTVFVAIDGPGASGKSTLACRIAAAFGAEIIRLDDFSASAAFSWMERLRTEVLAPIEAGAISLTYQPESWWGHTPAPVVDQPVTPIMIVEGVGSLHPDLRARWAVRLFVDTPASVCLERGIARDVSTGQPKMEIERLWRHWQAEEQAYLSAHDPAAAADFVVDGTRPFAAQL